MFAAKPQEMFRCFKRNVQRGGRPAGNGSFVDVQMYNVHYIAFPVRDTPWFWLGLTLSWVSWLHCY